MNILSIIAIIVLILQALLRDADALVMKKIYDGDSPEPSEVKGYRFLGYSEDIKTFKSYTMFEWLVKAIVVRDIYNSTIVLQPGDMIASSPGAGDLVAHWVTENVWKWTTPKSSINTNTSSAFIGFTTDSAVSSITLVQGKEYGQYIDSYMTALKIQAKWSNLDRDIWEDMFEVKFLEMGRNYFDVGPNAENSLCEGDLDNVGNRRCDYDMNNEECDWDGGDCATAMYPECYVINNDKIGDGICDDWRGGNYNSYDCGFDGGDCIFEETGSGPGFILKMLAGCTTFILLVFLILCYGRYMKQRHQESQNQPSSDDNDPSVTIPGVGTQINSKTSYSSLRRELILTNIDYEMFHSIDALNSERSTVSLEREISTQASLRKNSLIRNSTNPRDSMPPCQNSSRSDSLYESLRQLILPTHKVQTSCRICFEEFAEGDEIGKSKNRDCCHIYHVDCIVHWLMNNDECPICRTKFMMVV